MKLPEYDDKKPLYPQPNDGSTQDGIAVLQFLGAAALVVVGVGIFFAGIFF
jgi:hypothetical protein